MDMVLSKFVKEANNNHVNLGLGKSYGAINTMLNKGCIVALESEVDSRKKVYEITDEGRRVIIDEMGRLEELIYNGKMIVKGDAL
jgi:DNA-binding PadR family transcriptional regulator